MRSLLIGALLAAALVASPVLAQDEPPICTDRPSRANSVCTVPHGRWQVEADLVNFTRTDVGGTRTDVTLFAATTVKYGLDDRSDIEVIWAPVVEIETRTAGISDTLRGGGDLYLRYKRRLSRDGAPVGVSVVPFVKVPTARRGIGNREVEGGVALPVSLAGPGGSTVTFGPEVDLLLDADGRGHHAQVVNLVNLSRPLTAHLTVIGEVWSAVNLDPAGRTEQASADVALAWSLGPNAQVDAGANFGLTRDTPDVQVYVGLSRRF